MLWFRSNKITAGTNNSVKMKGCKTQDADNQPKQPRQGKIPEKRVTELCTHRWEEE